VGPSKDRAPAPGILSNGWTPQPAIAMNPAPPRTTNLSAFSASLAPSYRVCGATWPWTAAFAQRCGRH